MAAPSQASPFPAPRELEESRTQKVWVDRRGRQVGQAWDHLVLRLYLPWASVRPQETHTQPTAAKGHASNLRV